jgi:hypothetical protein
MTTAILTLMVHFFDGLGIGTDRIKNGSKVTDSFPQV